MVSFTSRRVKKEDMRRIAKSTGASIVTTLADMEGNETFDPSVLGEAEEVSAPALTLGVALLALHCAVHETYY